MSQKQDNDSEIIFNNKKLMNINDDVQIDTISGIIEKNSKMDVNYDKDGEHTYIDGLGFVNAKYSFFFKDRFKRLCNYMGLTLILFYVISNLLPISCLYLINFLSNYLPDTMVNVLSSTTFMQIIMGIFYILNLAIPSFFFFYVMKIPIKNLIPTRKTSAKTTVTFFVIGLMLMLFSHHISFIISSLIHGVTGIETQPANLNIPIDFVPFLIMFINIAIIPAFLEEFIFRGLILHSIKPHGEGLAIVMSGFLFALSHGSITQMFSAFMMGVVLGFIVVRTGSIKITILIHFANNALSFLMQKLFMDISGDVLALVFNGVYLIITIIGLITLIHLVTKNKDLFVFNKKNDYMTIKEKVQMIVKNPCIVSGTGLAIFLTILSAMIIK